MVQYKTWRLGAKDVEFQQYSASDKQIVGHIKRQHKHARMGTGHHRIQKGCASLHRQSITASDVRGCCWTSFPTEDIPDSQASLMKYIQSRNSTVGTSAGVLFNGPSIRTLLCRWQPLRQLLMLGANLFSWSRPLH